MTEKQDKVELQSRQPEDIFSNYLFTLLFKKRNEPLLNDFLEILCSSNEIKGINIRSSQKKINPPRMKLQKNGLLKKTVGHPDITICLNDVFTIGIEVKRSNKFTPKEIERFRKLVDALAIISIKARQIDTPLFNFTKCITLCPELEDRDYFIWDEDFKPLFKKYSSQLGRDYQRLLASLRLKKRRTRIKPIIAKK